MKLPHTHHLEEKSPQECVEQLKSGDEDELFLAVSKEFFERDDREIFPEIYAQYQIRYRKYIGEFSEVLGQPAFSVFRDEEKYPEWAVGEQVTVWEDGDDVVWLRLHHEDKELPIQIVLALRNE